MSCTLTDRSCRSPLESNTQINSWVANDRARKDSKHRNGRTVCKHYNCRPSATVLFAWCVHVWSKKKSGALCEYVDTLLYPSAVHEAPLSLSQSSHRSGLSRARNEARNWGFGCCCGWVRELNQLKAGWSSPPPPTHPPTVSSSGSKALTWQLLLFSCCVWEAAPRVSSLLGQGQNETLTTRWADVPTRVLTVSADAC